MTTEYFTFDLEDSHAGLLRRTLNSDGYTLSIEVVSGGKWIDDPDSFRYFAGYGGDQLDLVPLTEEQAREKAASLRVEL